MLKKKKKKKDEYNTFHDINERLARFLMRFRMILPDLYNHFEEEEVDFKEWTTSWYYT